MAELVESIRSMGVLEAALVVPIDAAVQARGELDDSMACALTNGAGRPWADGVPVGARWVLVAGHRRVRPPSLDSLRHRPQCIALVTQ